MRLLSGCVLAATMVLAQSAWAQNNPAAQAAIRATNASPPGRVGRVSLVSGKVGFRSLGETLWSNAAVNDPVSTGTSLRTDPQARAEMRIGADTIDLAGGAEVAVTRLDNRTAELGVARGRIGLDVPQLGAGETIEIDTPRGVVRLLQAGRYDLDTGTSETPPRIVAYTGAARFVGGNQDLSIKAGDALVLGGNGWAGFATEPATADDFARWCGSRAVDEKTLAAPHFVSPAMTGSAALDAAGTWQAGTKYGAVWVPKDVPTGWAPFHNGHWRWVAPWGWTWIDDQPWGFASSHYGRWAFDKGHWAWAPGAFSAIPVYAPAVVAFLGTPGVGLSYPDSSGPAIAWFPLAPGEVYWPSYTGDLAAIRALNRGQIPDLGVIRVRGDGEPPAAIADGHFANRQFAGVVPRPVFVASEPVAPAQLQLPLQRLRNAPAIMGSPRIGPPPPPAPPARIAAASAVHPRPVAHETALAVKRAAWAHTVRAATIRARNYRRSLLIRAAHLRAPGYALPRMRHTIVLRVAGTWRPLHRGKEPEKEKGR
jgi:hypothetical protein